jgi:hypothetical protein
VVNKVRIHGIELTQGIEVTAIRNQERPESGPPRAMPEQKAQADRRTQQRRGSQALMDMVAQHRALHTDRLSALEQMPLGIVDACRQ